MVLERPRARSYIRIPRPGRAMDGGALMDTSVALPFNDRRIHTGLSSSVRIISGSSEGKPMLTGIDAYNAMDVSGGVTERFFTEGYDGFMATMRASYVLNPNRPSVDVMPSEQRVAHEAIVSDVNKRWERLHQGDSNVPLESKALAVYIEGLDELSRSLTYITPRSQSRSEVAAAIFKLGADAKKGKFHPLPAGIKEAYRGLLDRAYTKLHPKAP